MTYDEAKARKLELERAVKAASAAIEAVPGIGSGAFGLTPDDVRARPDYQAARAAYKRAFAELRNFNAQYLTDFRNEIREERKNRA